jgi:hypothetical protein
LIEEMMANGKYDAENERYDSSGGHDPMSL